MLMFAHKNHFWNAQQARQLPGFQRNFAAFIVLNFCSREFPLSTIANLFEFRCQQKQLMLLSYKICPCSTACELMSMTYAGTAVADTCATKPVKVVMSHFSH